MSGCPLNKPDLAGLPLTACKIPGKLQSYGVPELMRSKAFTALVLHAFLVSSRCDNRPARNSTDTCFGDEAFWTKRQRLQPVQSKLSGPIHSAGTLRLRPGCYWQGRPKPCAPLWAQTRTRSASLIYPAPGHKGRTEVCPKYL